MKRCPRCEQTKARESFSKQRRRKDGLQTYCKACVAEQRKSPHQKAVRAAYMEEYRERELERVRGWANRYARSEKGKRKHAEYLQTDAGKAAVAKGVANYKGSEKHQEADRRYKRELRKRRPWTAKARRKVGVEVERGRWPPASELDCEIGVDCDGPTQYHHDSYREEHWLNVRPLCRKHHQEWHRHNVAEEPNQ